MRGVIPVFCAAALAPRGVVVKRLLTGIGLMAVELLTATLEAYEGAIVRRGRGETVPILLEW